MMARDQQNTEDVGLQPGTKIGKYEVEQRLGIGGQAIVYKCRDPLLDRYVAVKQISSHLAEDPAFLRRFREEARTLARLGAEQPAIVTIYELVEDQRGLFIVMEYVEGHTLEATLRDNPGPVDPKAVLQLLWRIAAAMNSVHRAGIIHRDLKPGNIMVSAGLHPKIMDFGVAASQAGQASMAMGTTKYMAPELFEGGDVDARADIYSVGFIIYEMLLGRDKFNEIFADVVRDPQGDVLRWMKWHGNMAVHAPAAHEVNPNVPVALSEIVSRMTAKDRDQRFASMEALGVAIKQGFSQKARAGRGPQIPPPAQTPPAAPPGGVAAPAAVQSAAVPAGGSAAAAQPSGQGLDAGGLEIQPPPVAAPQAVAAEGPATAPIPKKKLSKRTKLVIAAGAAGVVLAAVIALGVMQAMKASARRDRIETALEDAVDEYQAARNTGNVEGLQAAIDELQDVESMAAGTSYAARARVLVYLAQAYKASADTQWDEASEAQEKAEEAITEAQREYSDGGWSGEPKLQAWARQKRDEVDSFEDHLLASRRFVAHKRVADAIMDVVHRLAETGDKLDGEEQVDAVDEVERARRMLQSEADAGDSPAEVTPVVEALNATAQKLRDLPAAAPVSRRQGVLLEGRQRVVPQAQDMLPQLRDLAATNRHQEETDAYRTRVDAAWSDVQNELTRRLEIKRQRQRDELQAELDGIADSAREHLSQARKQAAQGKISLARERHIPAAKTELERLMDWTVPRETAAELGREYEDQVIDYRETLADDVREQLKDTELRVDTAATNWQKENAYAKAKEAVAQAKRQAAWAAAARFLETAIALAKEIRPEEVEGLQEEYRVVRLRESLAQALKLQSESDNAAAVAKLENILSQDPPADIAARARRAKADAQSKVDRARLVEQGKALASRGQWEQAKEKFEQAKAISADDYVLEQIVKCDYHIGLARADELLKAEKLEEAIRTLEALKEDNPDKQVFLDARIRRIEKLRAFREKLAQGEAALGRKEWLEARELFQQAISMYEDDPERIAPAQAGLRTALFNEWVSKGVGRMGDGDYISARAYFRTALDYVSNPEEEARVNELIRRCERAIADQEEG